jgi:hypothetical protein
MKTLFAVMLLLTVDRLWAQPSNPIDGLRDACVAEERVSVASDANDYSHLKNTDWANSSFCVGLIKGFEVGAAHTIYVLSKPKRLEFVTPLPNVRQIAKAVVTFIDEHPAETDPGGGECAAILQAADEATRSADEDTRADFEECRAYWKQEFPNLSDRTRSIITLSFSMLVRPFITRPLRKLFSTDTNVTPEDTFKGKIIIVDLPVQEFFLAGRVASLAWKYCFQRAVLSRPQPTDDSFLRPVFLWADECQNFVTEFDAAYQAVARSAGGCTVYLVQNRESLLRVLHSPSAVDSLLGNLQCKCFCQNSSIETNDWAAKLLGEQLPRHYHHQRNR